LNHASAFDTTVTYSLGGTAGEGSDYATITTDWVTTLPNSTHSAVSNDPSSVTEFEGNETILLTLTGGSSGTGTVTPSLVNGSAIGTINDGHAPIASVFFFNDTAATEIYTLSLHDALPICLNHASAFDTTVTYSLGGTAGEGSDYATITTHSVTILAGSTSTTVWIEPTTAELHARNQTVLLTLTGGSNGNGTVTASLVN